MRKKIILYVILIFSSVSILAQEKNTGQAIELPDFVITGIQSVTVPILDKKKSAFIHIISPEFLQPNYDTEEFSLLDNSNPIKQEMEIKSLLENYNGLLQIGAGTQTLPIGRLSFGINKKDILFNSHLFGINTGNYVPYSSYNASGAEIKLNYFVNHNAGIFKGLSIGLEGDFLRDKYNFYGSNNPLRLRENENYNGKFFISSKLNKNYNYGLNFGSNITNLKTDGIYENLLNAQGYFEYKFSTISLGTKGEYKIQKINANLNGYGRADFFEGSVYLRLSNSKIFDLKLGAQYSQLDTNSLFSPIAVLSIFVEEGVAMFISYEGKADLITYNKFKSENLYFENDYTNIYQQQYSNMKVIIKYDFSDIFELNAGFYSSSFDNYHYYEDVNGDNKFNIQLMNEVEETGGFINLTINAKEYGELFANVEFQSVTDSANFKIPYKPLFIGDLSYGYSFNFGLYTKVKLNYSHLSYTNLANTKQLPDYINFSMLFKYSLFKSFALTCSLENILNRDDYLLKNYLEKPQDIIVGIEYKW